MATKGPTKGAVIRLASSPEKIYDMIFHRRLYPESLAECGLCSGAEEYYAHLFFECPFARSI